MNNLNSVFNYYLSELLYYLVNRKNKYLLDWHFKHRKRLFKFGNVHNNESCFIIGNGPSLNKMDLSQLKDYHTFGLNKIYLLFDKVNLNLSYHVAVNPYVIEQSYREIESLQCPSFLSYTPDHGLVRNLDHIYWIATNNIHPVPYSFSTDLSQPICEGHTVTYVAMQIAYYMGFKKIFLIGVDHNFTVSGKPNEVQFLAEEDVNHFDPNYFKGKEWHLPDMEGSELAYQLAKFMYIRDGRQIYDATLDGKLQTFPKITYECALEMCNKKT